MEKTKKAIRMRLTGLMLIEAFALIIMIIDRTPIVAQLAEDVKNIHLGFTSGLLCAGIFNIVMLLRTQRDEKLLKQWAVQEQDERNIAIRAKAGMPMLLITATVMLMAGMIAGYWNVTIMKTLYITAVVQMVFGLIAKTYYQKTM